MSMTKDEAKNVHSGTDEVHVITSDVMRAEIHELLQAGASMDLISRLSSCAAEYEEILEEFHEENIVDDESQGGEPEAP